MSPHFENFDNFLSVFVHMSNNQEMFTGGDLSKVKDRLTDEGWNDEEKLPPGWKISNHIGDNIFVLLSREGKLYQNLDAAQDFINDSDEYDETTALNLEDLCLGLVEDYVKELNIEPEAPSSNILRRGAHFPCDQCGQSFRKKSNLSAHAKVHEGLKPYECYQCLKGFSLEENLKAHMMNHRQEVMKLHTCQVCSEPFYYLRTVLEHMEIAHPDFYTYKCNLCDKNFSRSEMLRIHKKNYVITSEETSLFLAWLKQGFCFCAANRNWRPGMFMF